MSKVNVSIWHDAVTGEILAIGEAVGESECVPIAGENQAILDGEFEEEELRTLHQYFRVDVGRRELIRNEDQPSQNA